MNMNRRQFIQASGAVLSSGFIAPYIVSANAKDPMKRIAMTTVTFRARFAQTRIKKHPPIDELMLLDVPEYYADRFKVHNVEFWSRHFESLEPDYLKKLKRRIRRAKSTLVNIQIDEPYNLADANEDGRQKSIALVKNWIDSAVAIGAKSARANTGRGDVKTCIRSFKEIHQYSQEKGILLLTENHGGLSSDSDKLVEILEAVGKKGFGVVPDFGNFPADTQMQDLKKILPYANHLISAKAKQFDDSWNHTLYDFDACVRLAESNGFSGYYSAEYYDGRSKPMDYEKVADWMLEHIKANL